MRASVEARAGRSRPIAVRAFDSVRRWPATCSAFSRPALCAFARPARIARASLAGDASAAGARNATTAPRSTPDAATSAIRRATTRAEVSTPLPKWEASEVRALLVPDADVAVQRVALHRRLSE